jgi:hypothetical protein
MMMTHHELQALALTRSLHIPEPLVQPDGVGPVPCPEVKMLLGGRGIMVGRLLDLGNGRWAAVPGTVPVVIGTPEQCCDWLAGFADCQMFPVFIKFSTPQMAHWELNEDVILRAVRKHLGELVASVADGPAEVREVMVGMASWAPQ